VIVRGLALGLLLAAQIGPVTLLIVRSVLRGGRAVAVGLAMAVGVAVVDLLYAGVGLVGIGRVLQGGPTRLAFGLVSAAILIVLGARTAWRGLRARSGLESDGDVTAPRRALVTAVAATALNPLTVALWTVSFPAAAPARAAHSTGAAALLLAGVLAGTLAWYGGFALGISLLGRRLGRRVLRLVDVLTGVALVAFGGVVAVRAADRQ
jgi:threonine/homoserine/homoserine lactone efflux protein